MTADSVTVLVIALNEEKNLAATVEEVKNAVRAEFAEYEIILIDDGSSDRTGAIADSLADSEPALRVLHNGRNKGLGWSYRSGLKQARMKYITWVCGKHDIEADQLQKIFAARTLADIVVPYHTNDAVRPLHRRIISRLFVFSLNSFFGLKLHHYNESVLLQTAVARSFTIRTNSYAFQAELLIKALKSGYSFVEVPIRVRQTPGAASKAFRPKNVLGVAKFFATTLWDVYAPKKHGVGQCTT